MGKPVVYVVTSGQYDEYSIEAIFTSMDKAISYRDWHPECNECIEEYELDPFKNNEDRVYQASLVARVTGDYIDASQFNSCRANIKYDAQNYYQHFISKTFPDSFGVRIVRYFYDDEWNEQEARQYMLKVIYELVALCKRLRDQGKPGHEISKIIQDFDDLNPYELN